MSEVNDNMIRSIKLFKEHLQLEKQIEAIDVQCAQIELQAMDLEGKSERLERRQDEISMQLAPALRKIGPVTWTHERVDYVIRLGAGDDLIIEPVKSFGHLAEAMIGNEPRFDPVTDAAFHEALVDVFTVDSGDPDDTGEFPPVKAEPQAWPRWTDKVRFALKTNGRQATIQNGVAVIDQEMG